MVPVAAPEYELVYAGLTMSAIDFETKSPVVTGDAEATGHDQGVLRKGNLEFTAEYGGNGSVPSYQETSGAPVEHNSPLGYNVGWFTIIFLNVGQMIGTGVFSTRMFSSNLNAPTADAGIQNRWEELAKDIYYAQRAPS